MKKLDAVALQMQKLAGIITESEYNTEMAKMDKMKSASKMEEAEEDSNIEGVMSKYKQPLLKALKARQMDQESEEAHDMVESLITKIATELGYAEATTTPWMEDEMLSGEYAPQEVLEYLKDMFMDMEEDQAASMNEMNKMNKMGRHSKMEEMNKMKSASKMEEAEEGSNEAKKQIGDWYWKTSPKIEDGSQKEIEDGIKAHYDEWMGSKDAYNNNMQDYFNDVENAGDWY
jgi:hypothetical protein